MTCESVNVGVGKWRGRTAANLISIIVSPPRCAAVEHLKNSMESRGGKSAKNEKGPLLFPPQTSRGGHNNLSQAQPVKPNCCPLLLVSVGCSLGGCSPQGVVGHKSPKKETNRPTTSKQQNGPIPEEATGPAKQRRGESKREEIDVWKREGKGWWAEKYVGRWVFSVIISTTDHAEV
jgi:hypothetical protein